VFARIACTVKDLPNISLW